MISRPSFSVGIEEEYLIVDAETRDLVSRSDPSFLRRCSELTGERSTPEYLQCQVEVGTKPHPTVAHARRDLFDLRRGVAQAASEHGYAAIAASTHPFARWREQSHTAKPRYDQLHDDLGQAVRRLLICGCHVHVGIEDEDLRIDLMNQAAYFLPHILALSCSSPFWEGDDTGLASYRLTVFDALPRTGLPDQVSSFGEYTRLVQALVEAGCIEDASKIWWDLRPSSKFPTLEQRVTDVCSTVDEACTIAALFQCILAYLYRLRSQNQRWRLYPATLINENRWRAQRYATSGHLVDHGKRLQVATKDLVEELIDILMTDAHELGAADLLLGARRILAEGTSADRQRRAYRAVLEAGGSRSDAQIAVVDLLRNEFLAGEPGEAIG